MTRFYALLKEHDAIWLDKTIPLPERIAQCDAIWKSIIALGNASTAETLTELTERVTAPAAAARP